METKELPRDPIVVAIAIMTGYCHDGLFTSVISIKHITQLYPILDSPSCKMRGQALAGRPYCGALMSGLKYIASVAHSIPLKMALGILISGGGGVIWYFPLFLLNKLVLSFFKSKENNIKM